MPTYGPIEDAKTGEVIYVHARTGLSIRCKAKGDAPSGQAALPDKVVLDPCDKVSKDDFEYLKQYIDDWAYTCDQVVTSEVSGDTSQRKVTASGKCTVTGTDAPRTGSITDSAQHSTYIHVRTGQDTVLTYQCIAEAGENIGKASLPDQVVGDRCVKF